MRNPVKKNIFLIILLLQSFFLLAQKLDKRYFIKTYWFVNNKDSAFYKSDTLKLIKHVKLAPEWAGREEYAEYEMMHLGHGDFIELRFKKKDILHFNWRQQNSNYTVPINTWIWKYRIQDSTIEIYDDKEKLIIKFKPLFEKEIEVPSRFDKSMIKTIELTVVKT